MSKRHYIKKPNHWPRKKPITVPIKERLEKQLIAEPNTGCLLWYGGSDKLGYGRIGLDNKVYLTHRIAYELYVGSIPKGMGVLHKCDTPACCNPHHLFIGTEKDNYEDSRKKDRYSRGERHGSAKLTNEQIMTIRQDQRPNEEIGREYGITGCHIGSIKRKKAWVHL